MNIWTVYHGTKDFGDLYVVRRFFLDKPTQDHFEDQDIEKVREWIQKDFLNYRQGMTVCLSPYPEDDK